MNLFLMVLYTPVLCPVCSCTSCPACRRCLANVYRMTASLAQELKKEFICTQQGLRGLFGWGSVGPWGGLLRSSQGPGRRTGPCGTLGSQPHSDAGEAGQFAPICHQGAADTTKWERESQHQVQSQQQYSGAGCRGGHSAPCCKKPSDRWVGGTDLSAEVFVT